MCNYLICQDISKGKGDVSFLVNLLKPGSRPAISPDIRLATGLGTATSLVNVTNSVKK